MLLTFSVNPVHFGKGFISGCGAICATFLTALLSFSVWSSPGAHGPNGEHLDMTTKVTVATHPKFETFTATFEVVGELFDDELVMYVHDFKTNKPVTNADIEIELGELVIKSVYTTERSAYVVTNPPLLQALHEPKEHELIFTILTPDNGDLLVGKLDTRKLQNEGYTSDQYDAHQQEHHQQEHHHYSFASLGFSLGVAAILFVVGYVVGSKRALKSSRSSEETQP